MFFLRRESSINYNPFADNTELHQKLISKTKEETPTPALAITSIQLQENFVFAHLLNSISI